ncbi:MAG: ATP-binding cassette domain-containing protein [Roseiflexaceae bacterium]
MALIEVEEISKEFRAPKRQPGLLGALRTLFTREYIVTHAVDGISFTVEAGELVGYLGPNGAGKSTTIKLLTGILTPTAGRISVAGLVPWQRREQNALNIGVVFGQRSQLWWDLPLIESFKLIAKMYRVAPATYQRNLDRFTALLDLDTFMNTPVRQLSLGQRMRGDLAAAMLYDPRILYLDEPTIGLDVLAKERIRQFIEEINREQQTTIILTTHDLADIERLCQRILLIDRGKLLYNGPVAPLKQSYAPYRVLVVQFAPDEPALADEIGITVPDAELVRREGMHVWLRFDPKQIAVPTLIGDITRRYAVTDLSILEPELEQVIRDIYIERQLTRK